MSEYIHIRSKLNSLKLGFIIGMIIPFIAILFFQFANFSHYGFFGFYARLHELQIFSSLISLCVIPNLLVFFLFVWKSYYITCKGIIFATIIYAITMMLFKFVL